MAVAEQTYITTETGAKQLLCPPNVPEYDQNWLSERERYLLDHGWERVGSANSGLPTFRDPKGSRLQGEVREVGTLPNKGDDLHPTIPIRQLHLPPAPYEFTLEEAVDVQRRRDRAGDQGPTPLERLDVLEKKNNDLSRDLDQFKARIQILLSTEHMTLEKMRLGLRELIGV